MTIFLLTIAVICITGIIVYKSLNNKKQSNTTWQEPTTRTLTKDFKTTKKGVFDYKWPFYKRKIMTRCEQGLFLLLKETFPNLYVFSQVHLTQLLVEKKDTPSWIIKNLYSNHGIKWMSVDFLLTNKEFKTIAVIEFDDASHNQQNRRNSDQKKNKILSDANINIIRIPTETIPTKEELITLIGFKEQNVTFTQDTIQKIAEEINPQLNNLINQNSKSKYPQKPYLRFKEVFSQLNVTNQDILEALLWKYGEYNKYSNDTNYQNKFPIIEKVQQMWQNFLSSGYHQNAHLTFHWWKNKLDQNKEDIHFPTIAHLTHLIHPQIIPSVDNYTFKVMNYLTRNSVGTEEKSPKNWEDILQFKKFITALSHSIPQIEVSTLNHFLYSIKIK